HEQDAKFLSYFFQSDIFYKQKRKLAYGVKVTEVRPITLNDVIIPLPPIDEQKRISAILDKFDSLCNDITSGIPAEINARRKQYEYYRDKLLTFKQKNL
ncbi:MAG: restriction endonuclease subunit S, partial [Synergistaceae bacterium]|nr:restriction endonuclease subunit S [Synergistaceae bacterium]